MIVATSGGIGDVVVGGGDILMPHKRRLNKKRGRKGKWSPFTEEGKKNIRELQKMVLSGLTDEEIGEKFGVTARYIAILRNRLKKKYGIDLDKRRKTLLHPPESRPRLGKGERTNLEDDLGTRTKKLFGGKSIDVPGILQLSDEELFFLREHPEEFAKKCIVWNGSRLELDDYQISWIKDKSKFKIANKSRRVGLSFATAFMAFHRAIFYPGSVELFVSIKEDRAKELMDYVYAFAGSNPDLFDGIFIERQRLYCHLTNGSRIYSLSNSPSGVRGIPQFKDVDVYIDEFAHFKTGQDERLYQALIASVSLGGTMSIWSTPFGKRGLFYKLWVESDPNHDKYNGYSRHEIPWWKCPRIDKKTIEAIKQATDPITFRQEFCCLPPGSLIRCEGGFKEINKIRPGDKVLTHKGRFKPVTHFFERTYNGDLVEIKTNYVAKFTTFTTPEHPYLCMKKGKEELEWVNAENIEKGDFLVYPILQEEEDVGYIFLKDFVDIPKSFRSKWKVHKMEKIPINEDFLRLCGYYISEGSLHRRGVQFTFNFDEDELVDDLFRIVKSIFNIKPKIYPRKENNTKTVIVGSVILRDLFKKLFGGGADKKKLPEWMLKLPENKLKAFLNAYWDRDGNRRHDFDSCITVSKELVFQIRDILLRLGKIPSITYTKGGFSKICGRRVKIRDKYQLVVRHVKTKSRGFIKNGFLFLPVVEVKRHPYSGKVYNLEVEEDNTYVTMGHTVHNCEFVSSGDELFTEDAILNAQENGILISTPQSANPFYIGVDFAQKHDSTAIIVVEFDGDAYIVRHIEEIKGKGIEYVIPKIEALFNKFRPTGIYCDETGMGIPLTRELKNRLGSVVNGVTFTNQKKDAMIMNLWHLFNDGKIKIPPHEELKNQLLRMERLETPTGAPKYTGKFEGKKDDLVWALALACHSDNRRWSGVISFGDVDILDHLVDFA